MWWVIFLSGLFVGANIGIVAAVLCLTIKKNDDLQQEIAFAEKKAATENYLGGEQIADCSACRFNRPTQQQGPNSIS